MKKKNPLFEIEEAKRHVELMSSKLGYFKSLKSRNSQIDALNAFIRLINSFEGFLNEKYVLRSVEGLLCGRLYSMMFVSVLENKGIDIAEIVRKLDNDIRYPAVKKEALVSFLNTENITACVLNNNRLPDQGYEYWQVVVDDLLNQLKRQMIWN